MLTAKKTAPAPKMIPLAIRLAATSRTAHAGRRRVAGGLDRAGSELHRGQHRVQRASDDDQRKPRGAPLRLTCATEVVADHQEGNRQEGRADPRRNMHQTPMRRIGRDRLRQRGDIRCSLEDRDERRVPRSRPRARRRRPRRHRAIPATESTWDLPPGPPETTLGRISGSSHREFS